MEDGLLYVLVRISWISDVKVEDFGRIMLYLDEICNLLLTSKFSFLTWIIVLLGTLLLNICFLDFSVCSALTLHQVCCSWLIRILMFIDFETNREMFLNWILYFAPESHFQFHPTCSITQLCMFNFTLEKSCTNWNMLASIRIFVQSDDVAL